MRAIETTPLSHSLYLMAARNTEKQYRGSDIFGLGNPMESRPTRQRQRNFRGRSVSALLQERQNQRATRVLGYGRYNETVGNSEIGAARK